MSSKNALEEISGRHMVRVSLAHCKILMRRDQGIKKQFFSTSMTLSDYFQTLRLKKVFLDN